MSFLIVREIRFLSWLSAALSGNAMFVIIALMMAGLAFMAVYSIFRESRAADITSTEQEIAEAAVREYIAAQAVREYLENKEKEQNLDQEK